MSTIQPSQEITVPQICTYVFRIQSEKDDREEDPNETRESIQNFIGSEHEVYSVSKMKFGTICAANSSVINHVIKIKTHAPTYVANKFMGHDWVREDHVIFKAGRPTAAHNLEGDK